MVKGWSIQKLSDLSYMKSGIGITEANIDGSGSYPCYGGNGLRGYASEYTHEGKFALIGRQGALCGNVTLVSGKFFASEHAVVVTPKTNTDIVFLSYVLKDLRLNQYSESSAQPGLSVNKVLEIECFVPNDETEQRCIAEALSDVDALLAALEKLIAKKRAIKQGAMQELLTGKRRLPGFEGEWVEKPMNDLVDIFSGGTPSTMRNEYWNGKIVWITPTDITNQQKKYTVSSERQITNLGLDNSSAMLMPPGTLILCSRATIGEISIAGVPLATNQGFKNLVCHNDVDNVFLYYALQPLKHKMVEQAFGTTFLEISKTALGNITVYSPPEKAEQTAIAEILSDMDAEIDALTEKLNKLRNIKQGMMSELLTGHIRLTEQEAEAAPEAVVASKIIELPKREAQSTAAQKGGHNQQFDDAVMIAGIVNVLYSDQFPLGRKKVQKCLYLLRRHQDESTVAFKKKAAGPYADEVRYKGGEPIAQSAKYITRATTKNKGTTFARGSEIGKALGYIQSWGKQADIQWVAEKLKFKKVDELELLATVDMAICDLTEAGTPVSVASIKHLIATNEEWKAKLKKQTFSDANIAHAIRELQTLF